ncbi:hypothetical protein ACQ4WP_11555 [Janthinobacterium sp. GB4P2]|uniref:hypothetical protein n=1 Tax=Janthinobacterium sp. GB4P2 TaxID=3424189 RepID=UPI003F22314B
MQIFHERADKSGGLFPEKFADTTIEMSRIYCTNGNPTVALKSSPERLLWSNFCFVERRKQFLAVSHWSG